MNWTYESAWIPAHVNSQIINRTLTWIPFEKVMHTKTVPLWIIDPLTPVHSLIPIIISDNFYFVCYLLLDIWTES